MTAAELEARIKAASTAHELNGIAEAVIAANLAPADQARLELLFESQCHMLFPHAMRGRR